MKLIMQDEKIASIASRPAWGAWIETIVKSKLGMCYVVAPRMGRVD